MRMYKCRSETKSVQGYRFTIGSVWRALVEPGPGDNMVVLSQIEDGKIIQQEIVSMDKLRKCFRRLL